MSLPLVIGSVYVTVREALIAGASVRGGGSDRDLVRADFAPGNTAAGRVMGEIAWTGLGSQPKAAAG